MNDMAFSGTSWYAATAEGLRVSGDSGKTWSGLTPRRPALRGAASVGLPRSARDGISGSPRFTMSLSQATPEFPGRGIRCRKRGQRPATARRRLPARRRRESFSRSREAACTSPRDLGGTWRATGFGLPEAPLSDLVVAGTAVLRSDGNRRSVFFARTRAEAGPPRFGRDSGMFPALAASADGSMVYAASATEGVYLIDWEIAWQRTRRPASRSAQTKK